jgi:diguanylate cyclase (GGDEF)-like protein/PAS domain S-box-containing protein
MSTPAWPLRVLLFSATADGTSFIAEELRRAGYAVSFQHVSCAEDFSLLSASSATLSATFPPAWDVCVLWLPPAGETADAKALDAKAAQAEVVSCFRQFLEQKNLEAPAFVIGAKPDFDLPPDCRSLPLQNLGVGIARSLMQQRAQREIAKAHQETGAVLRQSEERYRALVESTFDLVCELDGAANFTYLSPNYSQRLGFAAGELLGRPIFDSVHPAEQDAVVARFTNLMAGRPSGPIEFRHRHKNGGWIWLEGVMRALRRDEDEPAGEELSQVRRVVVTARDIGERKRYEVESATLISLAKAINAQADVPSIARELNTQLKPLLPFDMAFIALLKGDELVFIGAETGTTNNGKTPAGSTPRASAPVRIARSQHPEHPAWQAVARGAPWMVNRWSAPRTVTAEAVSEAGSTPEETLPGVTGAARAFIKIPLTAGDEIIGVLCFESHRPYVFTDDHLRLAGMAGEQVAVAVHQVRLLEKTLRAQSKYRALVQEVDAIVWEANPQTGAFTFVNPQAQNRLGFSLNEWLENPGFWPARIHPEDRERVLEHRRKAIAEGRDFQLEYRVLTAADEVLWMRDLGSVEAHREDDGKITPTQVRGLMIDITERKQFEMTLLERNTVLKAVQEAAADGICVMDAAGDAVSTNNRFLEMWGLSTEQLEELREKNQVMAWIASKAQNAGAFIERASTLSENNEAESRDELRLKDNRLFECYSAPAVTSEGKSFGRVWSFRDITARERFEQQLAHQAFHDPLTDLPNRSLFMDRLVHALSRSTRVARCVGVLFLDLDRFKVVNDSLGHPIGDELLVQVAERILRCTRPTDTAARFGGDEFTVLVEDIASPDEATHVASRILEGLQAPFQLAGHEVHVSASIGIALSASSADTPDELLRKADVAMYWSKNKGAGNYEVFDSQMSAQALERLQLEIDLRQAIKREQLYLCYQPLVNLESGRIIGAEALLRWQHPTRGLVSPDEFIPIAEETGMILPIGQWVLRQACRQAREWHSAFPDGETLKISINLSAKQLEQPELVAEVEQILRETGLPASNLELEITENVVMKNVQSNVDQLQALKKLGVRLAIDDFGIGYSSLSYLEHFPLDALKIDRAFVGQIGANTVINGNGNGNGANGNGRNGNGHAHNGDGLAILKAVSSLGKTLGVSVTAEGIETAAQRLQLRQLSCEIGQGFHFAKPLSGEALNALLLRNPRL